EPADLQVDVVVLPGGAVDGADIGVEQTCHLVPPLTLADSPFWVRHSVRRPRARVRFHSTGSIQRESADSRSAPSAGATSGTTNDNSLARSHASTTRSAARPRARTSVEPEPASRRLCRSAETASITRGTSSSTTVSRRGSQRCTTALSTRVITSRVRSTRLTVVRLRQDSTATAHRPEDEGVASAVTRAARRHRGATPSPRTAASIRVVRVAPQSLGTSTTTSSPRRVPAHRNARATGAASNSAVGTDRPATSRRSRWAADTGSARQCPGFREATASTRSEHSMRSPPGGSADPSAAARTETGATVGARTDDDEAEATVRPEQERSTATTAPPPAPLTAPPTRSAPGGGRGPG